MDWYLGCFKKYATFSGRARRSEYWFFALFNAIASFLLGFVDGMLGLASAETGLGPLGGLYALIVLIPSLAVAVRRLHDTDRSGWWLLLVFIPILGAIVLIVFFFLDSTPGNNSHGPNPKGVEG